MKAPTPFRYSGNWHSFAPEIDILGNSFSISDGDTTPSTTNHTDFGFIALSTSASHTFTIENSGNTDLNLNGTPVVEITGTHATDFTVTSQATTPILAGGSSTFTVEFEPSAAGLRQADISIVNDDSDENPYNFTVQGTGITDPEIEISGNNISISNGDTTPNTA